MDLTSETIPAINQTRRLYRETHMQYVVSSQDRPQNSPLYSIHTGLDSFILFNDEICNEQESLTYLVATPHCNVVADIVREEDMTEGLKQLVISKNHCKVITGIELQNNHPLLVNFENEDKNPHLMKNMRN